MIYLTSNPFISFAILFYFNSFLVSLENLEVSTFLTFWSQKSKQKRLPN